MHKLILLLLVSLLIACTHNQNVADNLVEGSKKQHVLLISIDGYRYDYTELHQAKNLAKIAENSAIVKQLSPSFPTLTFPNHLTLVTGLYPENHGIIDNVFYHPELERLYSLYKPETVTDGVFYQGVPIWSLAAQQGVKSATYFWPGSEAEIAGHRPNYWEVYDGKVANQRRVDQIIEWFSLPESQRPQFASLYFSSVDDAGHKYGPTANETSAAVQELDQVIGDLVAKIKALPIDINVIITSDHGMQDTQDHPRIYTDSLLNNHPELQQRIRIDGSGAIAFVSATGENKQTDLDQLGKILKNVKGLSYFQLADIPAHLHFQNHVAISDAILVVHDHYLATNQKRRGPRGMHGYDTEQVEDMNTVVYAFGPAFDKTAMVKKAKNIHLYPLMAHILSLNISEPIDGDLKILAPLLKKELRP